MNPHQPSNHGDDLSAKKPSNQEEQEEERDSENGTEEGSCSEVDAPEPTMKNCELSNIMFVMRKGTVYWFYKYDDIYHPEPIDYVQRT